MTTQNLRGDSPCAVDLSSSAIPQESSEECFTTVIETAETETSGFAGFGFSEALLETLNAKGYSDPSPIQRAAFRADAGP